MAFEYSLQTTKTAKSYNIDERDVLFIQLLAAGANKAEAYYCIYDHGTKRQATSHEQEQSKANEWIKNHPAAAVLITKLKHQRPVNSQAAQAEAKAAQEDEELTEEEKKKLGDKSYILKKLFEASKTLQGKEKAAVFMQIADLQRMKQEEIRGEEEKRRYFLPWRARCRACFLMKVFAEEQEKEGESPKE